MVKLIKESVEWMIRVINLRELNAMNMYVKEPLPNREGKTRATQFTMLWRRVPSYTHREAAALCATKSSANNMLTYEIPPKCKPAMYDSLYGNYSILPPTCYNVYAGEANSPPETKLQCIGFLCETAISLSSYSRNHDVMIRVKLGKNN